MCVLKFIYLEYKATMIFKNVDFCDETNKSKLEFPRYLTASYNINSVSFGTWHSSFSHYVVFPSIEKLEI